ITGKPGQAAPRPAPAPLPLQPWPRASTSQDWPMVGNTAANTYANPNETWLVPADAGGVVPGWSLKNGIGAEAAVVSSTIYSWCVQGGSSALCQYDLTTGTQRHQSTAGINGGAMAQGIAVSGTLVVAEDTSANLTAQDATTGKLV